MHEHRLFVDKYDKSFTSSMSPQGLSLGVGLVTKEMTSDMTHTVSGLMHTCLGSWERLDFYSWLRAFKILAREVLNSGIDISQQIGIARSESIYISSVLCTVDMIASPPLQGPPFEIKNCFQRKALHKWFCEVIQLHISWFCYLFSMWCLGLYNVLCNGGQAIFNV